MSEQFDDTGALLGFRSEEPPVEEPPVGEQQQEEDIDSESDEPGSPGVDASNDEDNSDAGDSGQEEQVNDDPAGLKAELDTAREKLEATEKSRRDWQSKAMSSDSDLGKALDALSGQAKPQAQSPAKTSTAVDKLKSMDPADMVDAGTVADILEEFRNEQAASKQQNAMNDIASKIDSAVRGKKDLSDVVTHIQENNLGRDPETGLLNDLGNYYKGRTHMLENKLKKAHEDGKIEGAKEAKARKKRQEDMPPVGGSRGEREATPDDPSGLLGIMATRRKARGISSDGGTR